MSAYLIISQAWLHTSKKKVAIVQGAFLPVDELSLIFGFMPVGIQERDGLLGERALGNLAEVLQGLRVKLLSEGLCSRALWGGNSLECTGGCSSLLMG
jgi:hypothetical protein